MKKFKKVYIEITNICNLNCSFCNNNKREKKFMNVSDFSHIIDEVKNYKQQFDITTEVKVHEDGTKGGIISGEGMTPYEKVEFEDNPLLKEAKTMYLNAGSHVINNIDKCIRNMLFF